MGLLDPGFVNDLKADGEPRVSAVRDFSSISCWGCIYTANGEA